MAERSVMSQIFTIGRVTSDFELQFSTNNTPYVRFSLAETIGFGANRKTQYLQVWTWSVDAKRLVKNKVKKGSLLWVSGSLELEEYQRNDRTNDKRLKVLLDNWGFVQNSKSDHNAFGQAESDPPLAYDTEQPVEMNGDKDTLPK